MLFLEYKKIKKKIEIAKSASETFIQKIEIAKVHKKPVSKHLSNGF